MVHELWQDENGDLFVKPIPQVLEAVGWEEPLQMQALTGEWKLEKNQAEVDAPYDFGALLLNPVGKRAVFPLTSKWTGIVRALELPCMSKKHLRSVIIF